jgi:ribose 5-phosphate isomerase B
MKIGIAADHGGFLLKEEMSKFLIARNYSVKDFGAKQLNDDDDYPDFVGPLGQAIANGDIDRGIAICGSGVGASIAANKIPGVRAALIHETFSAHQGVEDDNMNLLCMGGRVTGNKLAEELIVTFLNARFTGADRHKRRLEKVSQLEKQNKFLSL